MLAFYASIIVNYSAVQVQNMNPRPTHKTHTLRMFLLQSF